MSRILSDHHLIVLCVASRNGFLVNSYLSQHVPKSTRTHFWSTRTWPLVNSYLPLVNSYPESKNGVGWSMIEGGLVSLGPNKPFQTLKHQNLLFALRLGSCQPVQRSQLLRLWSSLLGACSIIHHHYNWVFAIGRGSGQLWQIPYADVFRIAYLNDQINTVLLTAIRWDFG